MLLLAAIAIFAGATVQSVTGFGFVLVAGPALFAVLEPEQALSVLFIVGSAVCVLVLASEGRRPELRTDQLRLIIPAAVPGCALGVLILQALSKPTLQVAVGIAVIIAALLVAQGVAISRSGRLPDDATATPLAVGFLMGVLTTSTGTSAPPIVLWFQRLELPPVSARDTLVATFLALNPIGGAALVILGKNPGVPSAAWILVPLAAAIAGYFTGRDIFRRLDAGVFRVIALTLVVLAGVASVVAGLAG